MKFSKILCRYGEVTLKKDYTRKFFEDKLISNITKGLKSRGIEFKITREPGRLYIKTSNVEKSINILKKVFGLTTISPIKEFVIKADMEKLVRFGEKFARNFIKKEDTFAVRAKRTGNNAFTSQMIERRLGTEIVKKIGAKAIVTGESLGQVASQTLDNINVLDQAINILVLRPLIGFDKEEIVDISRKIGTYESSILPSSGCSAVPRSPRTKGRLDEVLEEEKKLDIPEMLNKILKTKKTF